MRQNGLFVLVSCASVAVAFLLGAGIGAGPTLAAWWQLSEATTGDQPGVRSEAGAAMGALEAGMPLRGAPVGVQAVAFSPRGNLVAAGGLSRRVVVWSTG